MDGAGVGKNRSSALEVWSLRWPSRLQIKVLSMSKCPLKREAWAGGMGWKQSV